MIYEVPQVTHVSRQWSKAAKSSLWHRAQVILVTDAGISGNGKYLKIKLFKSVISI